MEKKKSKAIERHIRIANKHYLSLIKEFIHMRILNFDVIIPCTLGLTMKRELDVNSKEFIKEVDVILNERAKDIKGIILGKLKELSEVQDE